MPKSFAEDGALGAWGGDGSSQPVVPTTPAAPASTASPSADQPTGGFSQSDFDNYSQNMFGNADGQPTPGNYTTGGGRAPKFTPYTPDQQQGALDYAQNMFGTQDGQPTPGTYTTGPNGFSFKAAGNPANPSSMIGQGPQNTGGYNRVAAFSQGGAIPDSETDDGVGSPGQTAVQRALRTVSDVLSFGYKQYGLTTAGSDGGAINEAAAMPTIPGNQSETPGPYKPGNGGKLAAAMPSIPGNQSENGRPPQPMPGPLPPTSNPFGKRADAGDDDNDGDEGPGAIDTDEDAA